MDDSILKLNPENFEEEVLQSNKPVLVDFWAEWCGACKMITPVLEDLAADYSDKLKVGKLNIDEGMDYASSYGIMSIPTLIVFNDGQEVERVVGYVPKEELESVIEKYI